MRKKAFILVVGIIIAAGALFTAVYDVIYRYNSYNTINLNAATVDKTGQTSWSVEGTARNGADETTTLGFDQGTYMMLFNGQTGSGGLGHGEGAQCIAFYKGSSMTVVIGVGGGKGGASDGSLDGGGKTIVTTNFALPVGYTGTYEAIASGGGAGNPSTYAGYYPDGVYDLYKVMDGTFKGKSGNSYWSKLDQYGSIYRKIAGNNGVYPGTPASQTGGGAGSTGARYPDGYEVESANLPSGEGGPGCGGGAGYYDGGFGISTRTGGGGSCTPWCYPLQTSDVQSGPKRTNGERCRLWTWWGEISFRNIDPMSIPSGKDVSYGGTAELVAGVNGERTPRESVRGLVDEWQSMESGRPQDYDCGIRTGWVYSVSEDGKSWHGVGPDGLRSATKQDI